MVFAVRVFPIAVSEAIPVHGPYRAAVAAEEIPLARKEERCPQVLARPVAFEVGAGTRKAKQVVLSLDADGVRRRAGDDRADAPGRSRYQPDSPFLEVQRPLARTLSGNSSSSTRAGSTGADDTARRARRCPW